MENIQDVNAGDFNIEALNDIIKDIRNTRKAVLSIGENEDTQTKYNEAKTALEAGLKLGGIEGLKAVSEQAAVMRRAEAKLNEDPAAKENAFQEAVLKLVDFTATNEIEEYLQAA